MNVLKKFVPYVFLILIGVITSMLDPTIVYLADSFWGMNIHPLVLTFLLFCFYFKNTKYRHVFVGIITYSLHTYGYFTSPSQSNVWPLVYEYLILRFFAVQTILYIIFFKIQKWRNKNKEDN